MKTYIHKQTGERAVAVEENGTMVTLETEGTNERKSVNMITLRRWWDLVEGNGADVDEGAEEAVNVDSVGDDAVSDDVEGTADECDGSEEEDEVSDNETVDDAVEADELAEADTGMNMSETISALESLFDKLNGIYFDGMLPRPVITVQSTPRAYGHCSTKKIWKSADEAQYEINIGAEHINRQMPETAATMCHEMVHLHCLEEEIADTCQNGRYHNGAFRKEAEARDLAVEYNRSSGYSRTKPTAEFIEKLAGSGFDMSIRFARIVMEKPESRRSSRSKQRKYVCPECGQTVKSAAELRLICGDCGRRMEEG